MVKQIERCRAFIPVPIEGDDGLIRCGAIAWDQCQNCSDWFCAEESDPHLIVCVRCGGKFCRDCLAVHRLTNTCLEESLGITDEDVRSVR